MDMLMQVLLKLMQTVVESMEGRACTRRQRVVARQGPDLCHECAGRVVLLSHHCNRACNGCETRERLRHTLSLRPLELGDVRKEHHLFFCEMLGQLIANLRNFGLDLR